MKKSMANYSFNIKTSRDLLNKLLEDHEDYKTDTISSRFALNCAFTGWHLTEWVYHEYKSLFISQFSDLKSFVNDLKVKCQSLSIMQDISNGTKHLIINKYSPQIKNTDLHEGVFDQTFDRTFDVSDLIIMLNNGSELNFEDEIESLVDFWVKFFKVHNLQ